jgi:hypothetical protein
VVVHTGALPLLVSGASRVGAEPDAPPVPALDEPLPALPDEVPVLPAVPLPVEPVSTGVPPEQVPTTEGWHTKPSPQSASALQGNSHR